jgi:hypothetical protein
VTTCAASGRVNIVHNATTVCRDVQQKSVTWTSKLACMAAPQLGTHRWCNAKSTWPGHAVMSAASVPASSELAAGSGRRSAPGLRLFVMYESAADPVVARLCGAGALVWVGLVVRFVCVIRVPVMCPCARER